MEYIEIRRQHNLAAIAARAAKLKNTDFIISDEDWLVEFVEASKDSSDEILQDFWAKLLAGEMDAPGT